MLVMFDIDGTLLRCGGAGRRALDAAFEAIHGVEGAMSSVRFAGSTDPVIVRDAHTAAFDRAPTDPEVDALMAGYLERLAADLASPPSSFEVMPGAVRIASTLAADGRFCVGLATGNVEAGARIKLAAGGLDTFFEFGGFGSDAAVRAELVRCGVDRGQAIAVERRGRRFDNEEILVIGDTEHDVTAAHAAGAVAVGVRAGSSHVEAMEAAGVDHLFDSFLDPALWRLLGYDGAPADAP